MCSSDLGQLVWVFSAADSTFDFLGAGETLTIKYNIVVYDAENVPSAPQVVTITVLGSNDSPKFESFDSTSLIDDSTSIFTDSGDITFSDIDTTDTHKFTVDLVAANVSNGNNKNTIDHKNSNLTDKALDRIIHKLGFNSVEDLVSCMKVDPNEDTNNSIDGTGGTATWEFSIDSSYLDFLSSKNSLILTYNIQLSDGHGGTVDREVVISLDGSSLSTDKTHGHQGHLNAADVKDLDGLYAPGEYDIRDTHKNIKALKEDINNSKNAGKLQIDFDDNESIDGQDFRGFAKIGRAHV